MSHLQKKSLMENFSFCAVFRKLDSFLYMSFSVIVLILHKRDIGVYNL